MKNVIRKFKVHYNNIKPYFYLGNLLAFISKIVLFFLTKSLLFIISSFYNLGIGLAKKKIYFNKSNNSSIGFLLIIASISFIAYSIWTILSHKITYYNFYTGLVIATVTFYDIGYSIYEIIKKSRNSKQNNLLVIVNFITALISLELTQTALLSFTQIGVDNSLYNGMIGIIVGTISLGISIMILFKKSNS